MVAETASRTIILGAKGFLAAALCAELERRKSNYLAISSTDLDLRSRTSSDALRKILAPSDTLCFISALTPDKGKDAATMTANIAMAEHVAAALAEQPCRHCVYVSSDAVYGEQTHLIRESLPCDPPSFHGIMHITREKIVGEAAARAKVPYLILRPTAVYGRGDTHNSYGPNRFMRTAIKEGKITLFGSGADKRDHLSLADFVAILADSIGKRATGTVNVASGQSRSFREVADIVRAAVGSECVIESTAQQGPPSYRYFDTTMLLQRFPEFSPTSLEIGITRSLEQG